MDKHIDNDETQRYAPTLAHNLERIAAEDGLEKALKAMLLWTAGNLTAKTTALREALAGRRETQSGRSTNAAEKTPVMEKGRRTLKAFVSSLKAAKDDEEETWDGDLELFTPGGFTAIKKGAGALHLALTTAYDALKKDNGVPGQAGWLSRLDTARDALAPFVTRTQEAAQDDQDALSEQSAEREAWDDAYHGAALVLRGTLTLLGRGDEARSLIPHLTVSGRTPAKPAPTPTE